MKTKRKTAKSASVTEGGGNVFADLSLKNADQELMKARLTLQIYRIIKERGITQTEAGKILWHSAAPCLGVGPQSRGQLLGRPPY